MKIEVRCCCQPQKLLGWLPAPDGISRGTIVRFVVSPSRWFMESIYSEPSFKPMDVIELPAETFVSSNGVPSLALKSEETPIARLRLIRGFVENTHDSE